MVASALLTDENIVLENVPDIIDLSSMLNIAAKLGVECSRQKDRLELKAANLKNNRIDREDCSNTRTSFLFAGPLLARCGKAVLWPPGGDGIGRRRLDSHLYGLRKLGARVESETCPFTFTAGRLSGEEIFFDEASVTATEHILLASVMAEGTTVIRNAACEPHVRELGELLLKMGARISGLGTNTITVEGVEKLGGAIHRISGDHIEAGSFLAAAAVTGGEISLTGISPGKLWMLRRIFERFGLVMEFGSESIRMPAGQSMRVAPDFGNAIPSVSDGPWPQYPSDMMSCTIVMATQAQGTVLFFEKMFESRIYFVDRLISMGANAVVCDPHRVLISGPSRLRAMEMSSPDIRAGMAMLIAALCAEGTSLIRNADVISRGYDSIVDKLAALGAQIELCEDY